MQIGQDGSTPALVPPVVTEDARDAARYRFWREKACNQPSLIARNLTSCLYQHEIDEAIDGLMDQATALTEALRPERGEEG